MTMTREEFEAKRAKRKKMRRLRKRIMRWSLLIVGLILVVVGSRYAIRGIVNLIKSAFEPQKVKGQVMTEEQFDTPTPTPTYVPVEGLVRRDPKNNCKLVLKIKSDYENNDKINARANPSQQSTLLGKVKVGDEFEISCSYTDPEHKGYTGFYGSEIGVDGHIVWIYNLYVDLDDVVEPWAVSTIDVNYAKKYGKSNVTIRQYDGNSDANVRSEPWESEHSSYGKIRINTTFVASKVYVTDDKQWYGFPSSDLELYLDGVVYDPDGIVWVYSYYCTIDPRR